MGSVYEAVDTRLGNRVALKRAAIREDDAREAFRLEARILSALRHPALPVVIDYFSEEGEDFLVMDYVDGEDLSELLTRSAHPLAIADVLRWADRILDALAYLHGKGVVHRDIKPANLKLTASRDVVLLDFGISKGSPDWQGTHKSILSGGTNGYSPFEQLMDFGTDERSDLFALGVTLYQLLTGVLPPDARARAKALVAGKADPMLPADAISRDVPSVVASALVRATALEREDRFASAEDFREALRPSSSGSSEPPRPRARKRIVVSLPSNDRGEPSVDVAPAAVAPAAAVDDGQRASRMLPALAFRGHGRVSAAAFSADGRVAFSAGDDGAVRIWSVGEREAVARLDGHDGAVHALAVSADGFLLATGGADATVRLWEVSTGRELVRLGAHGAPVRAVAFSPDATAIVSGDATGRAIVWDAASAQGLYRIDEPGAIGAVDVSSDGRLALAGGDARTVGVWEIEGGAELHRLEGHRQVVYSAVFAPDGGSVVTGGGDATARVHAVDSGLERVRFERHRSAVRSVAVTPDGRRILSGSIGGIVRWWDAATGRELGRHEGRMGLLGVGTLGPDHDVGYAFTSDGSVALWELGPDGGGTP